MSKNAPILTHRPNEPLQDYYVDENGDMYSVAKLIDDTKHLKPFKAPLASLSLTGKPWRNFNIYELGFHCRAVNDADLSKPIILDWNGEIADGRHRVIKAIMNGKKTIKAVRITWRITPCRKGGD
jgi:hypothetical protein